MHLRGSSYAWTGAATGSNQTLTNTPGSSGTYSYTVEVTDVDLCKNTSVATVIVSELNPGSISATDLTVCEGQSPVQITSGAAASGGSGSYAYQWQTNVSDPPSWSDISGAQGEVYTPSAITVDR